MKMKTPTPEEQPNYNSIINVIMKKAKSEKREQHNIKFKKAIEVAKQIKVTGPKRMWNECIKQAWIDTRTLPYQRKRKNQ